jgi:outer membrane protein assembly factor BamB
MPEGRGGLFAAVVLSFALAAAARGQPEPAQWNQFRGPHGQGFAPEACIPAQFGPDTNLVWKTAVPEGHSSPILWGSRIFLTAREPAKPKELVTLAVDRQRGTILWRKTIAADSPGCFHQLNNAAASTPVADARHVFAYFGTFGLVCYDHGGNEIWQRRLATPESKYGVATSPILYQDTVILVLDGDRRDSRLLAVRQETGETAWEQPRPMFKAGWSTPVIFRHDGVDTLLVLGSRRLTACQPASGEEIWWLGGFPEETVGIPATGGGLIFAGAAALGGRGDEQLDAAATWKTTIAEFDLNHDGQIQREEMTRGFAFIQRPELPKDNPGYGLPVKDMDALLKMFDHDKNRIITEAEWKQTMSGFAAYSHPFLAAIRPGATQDARPSHVAWEIRRGIPETPSPLFHQGRLYLVRDGGLLTCLEAATGRELFRERVGATGQYIASPIATADKILVASCPGIVTVLAAGSQFQVLARNPFNEEIFATPALADNRLYVRTAGHLFALGQ